MRDLGHDVANYPEWLMNSGFLLVFNRSRGMHDAIYRINEI